MGDIIRDILNIFFGGEHHHRHHHRHPNAHQTDLVISKIVYNHLIIKNSIVMSLSLNVQEFVTATLGLIDHVTQVPVDATFANTTFAIQDSAIASADADGKIVGLAEGSTNLVVSTDATYTNSLGKSVTETKSALIGVVVSAVVTANSVDLVVSFSPPAANV